MYHKVTKRLPLIALWAICMCDIGATAQTVLVQFRNGHSGKPIGNGKLIHVIFVTGDVHHFLNLHTDAQGMVEFDAQGASEFKVNPVEYAPCDEPTSAATKNYSVAEVTNDGLVTFNDCGQLSPPPVPGRIIYFVKSQSRWDLLKKSPD